MKEMQNEVVYRGRARQDKCYINEAKNFSMLMKYGLQWQYSSTTIFMKNLSLRMLILTNILHKRINNFWQNQGGAL